MIRASTLFQLVNPCAAKLVKLMQALRYCRRENFRGILLAAKLNVRCHTQTLVAFNGDDDKDVATCFTVFMSMRLSLNVRGSFFFYFRCEMNRQSNKLQITNRLLGFRLSDNSNEINTRPSDVHIQWRMSSTESFKSHSTMHIQTAQTICILSFAPFLELAFYASSQNMHTRRCR